MSKKRKIFAFLAVFASFLAVLPWIGAEKLSIREVASFMIGEWTADGMIFFQIRIPRVLMGLLAGGALGMAGAALQVMFRLANSRATVLVRPMRPALGPSKGRMS